VTRPVDPVLAVPGGCQLGLERPEAFPGRARKHPGRDVLLGSDFPNIPYAYADQIVGLVRLGLGELWLRAVCWDNAAAEGS
jgi:hypothetical protein